MPANVTYVIVYVLMLSLIVVFERRVSSAMGFGTVTLIAYAVKMVGVPQHLFTMSYVRVRIAQYARWSTTGNQQAIRRDVVRSVLVMIGITVICALAAALGGMHLAEFLFGSLSAVQATEFQLACVVLSLALLPMFVNALFTGVASANERLVFLIWPTLAQAAVLAVAAILLPGGLGAVAVAAIIATGHISASLVWLLTSRHLFTAKGQPTGSPVAY